MEKTIRSLSEFLSILDKYQTQFSQTHQIGSFVFRGMSDRSWKLLPGVFRKYPEDQKSAVITGASYSGKKSIFPGLDGIGRYINRYYKNNPDDICKFL